MKKLTSILFVLFLFIITGWRTNNFVFQEVTQTHLPYTQLTANTMDIEVADLDKDNDLDIVLAMEFKPNIILINDGNGKFNNESAARLPQVVHDSEDIALGDFDNDKDLDIIFVSEDDGVHEYYLNDGKGYFVDNSFKLTIKTTANAIDAADYDKDGDLDLILGNAGQDVFLINDGKGNFTDDTKNRMPADNTITQDVQSADLDRDGDLDLVLGSENGNSLYLNNGKGVFTNETGNRFPVVNEETRKIRLADIDTDGDLDAFVCNVDFGKNKDKANRILINDGKANFKDETAVRLASVNNDMHTGDVAFADLDGDKDLDVLIANLFGGYSQIYLNEGKGIFKEVTDQIFNPRLGGDAISIEINDFNKDGRPDIYFGFFRGGDRLFFTK